MSEKRIAGLDGVRAIAVLMVFTQHNNNLAASLEFGTFGVWAFFVLSGFLIVRILYAQRLDIETGQETTASAWRRFFLRRTLRIFPIYYLVLAICAALTLSGPLRDYSDGPWPFYWSYLTNVYIQTTGHLVGSFTHLWSLAVEEQFYLVAAPVFLLLPSRLAPYLCGLVLVVGVVRGLMISHLATLYFDSIFSFYMLALGGLAGLFVGRAQPPTARMAMFITAPIMILAAVADYAMTRTLNHAILLFPLFVASLYIFIFLDQKTILVRILAQLAQNRHPTIIESMA
jgi:peptidoglycan/LPS O-acetylase OafA/YrhL